MKEVKISVTLVNEILEYLGSRPYNEVTHLVSKILSLNSQLVESPVTNQEDGQATEQVTE